MTVYREYRRRDRLSVPITLDEYRDCLHRRQVLKRLLLSTNGTRMAEVGVRLGTTTFFLLDSIPNLVLYAIDTDISQFYNEKIKNQYKERLIPLEGTSDNVHSYIGDNSLDLIFIDADHSYECASNDIKNYTPKLKSTGILAGHDIDYPSVNQAVRELVGDFDVAPDFVWIKK